MIIEEITMSLKMSDEIKRWTAKLCRWCVITWMA